MKKRVISAIITAAVSAVIYFILNRYEAVKRGYDAFGGEEILLFFGFFIALLILISRGEKSRD